MIDQKATIAASPFVLLKMLFSSLEEDWPPTEVSVTRPDEYIPEEMAPSFIPLFFFFHTSGT